MSDQAKTKKKLRIADQHGDAFEVSREELIRRCVNFEVSFMLNDFKENGVADALIDLVERGSEGVVSWPDEKLLKRWSDVCRDYSSFEERDLLIYEDTSSLTTAAGMTGSYSVNYSDQSPKVDLYDVIGDGASWIFDTDKVWNDRAIFFLEKVAPAVQWVIHRHVVMQPSDFKDKLEQRFGLKSLIDLVQNNPDLPRELRKGVVMYLETLPSFDLAKSHQQKDITFELHFHVHQMISDIIKELEFSALKSY